MRKDLIPPVNMLCALTKGRCPHCTLSETETYTEGRTVKECEKLRAEGKTKPLWVCNLRKDMMGHRPCTIDEWKNYCPFH